MVSVKERLNPVRDRVNRGIQEQMTSSSVQVKDFKIYVEADKARKRDSLNNGTKGKSNPHNSGRYLRSTNDVKSIINNLDKIKIKTDKSLNGNAGRKVLADIGNVNRSFSKTEELKNSRLGLNRSNASPRCTKGKRDTMMNPQRRGKSEVMLFRGRNAVDLGNVSSDRHLRNQDPKLPMKQDSVRLDQTQATEDNQTSKKTSINKNTKAISNELKTKFEGRSSAVATVRKSARIPLHLTRKSFPVLKQVSRVETSGSGTAKNSSEKSDNFRGKHGFPVKPSVRTNVPKPSILRGRPPGNRVSGGFVSMSSRAQTKVDAEVLSRKSIKQAVKTAATSLITQKKSKPSHVFTTKKIRPRPVDLSKTKQDSVSSTSENISSLVSHEIPTSEGDVFGGSTSIARRKSERRNSYTCSLMSRSKLLKECCKITSEETLPIIYDDRNHLEVFEYVDDIYQYYWVMEGQNPLLKNYMDKQRDITPQMRGLLINWLVEVHLKFDLMEETLFLTVTLLDRYLSLESIKKNEMQLVGLTALLLASKYEDFWHPRVTDLISISAESYTRDQMLNMEKAFLKKLKFRLNEPTPYVFMLRFLKAAQSDMKFEHLAFYLIELCLVENEALNYKPSMLCASAVYVTRCTLRMTPPWTPLLSEHARYEESEIRSCAEMILKFHKAAAKTSVLRVSHEKYSKGDYSRVGTIKPLDKLPS